MKTLNLTMLTAVRLALMIDASQGNRKDLRTLGDVRRRLGISDETLQSVVKPVAGGAVISDEVKTMPDIGLTLAPEEARRLLEVIDAQTFTVRDLEWVEPLVKDLAA